MNEDRSIDPFTSDLCHLLVNTMNWITCLKGDDVLTAQFSETMARLSGCAAKVNEIAMLWQRKDLQFPRDIQRAPMLHLSNERMTRVPGAQNILSYFVA